MCLLRHIINPAVVNEKIKLYDNSIGRREQFGELDAYIRNSFESEVSLRFGGRIRANLGKNKLIMKLIQVALLCLPLSVLADGWLPQQGGFGGGFGGFSGIFGLFILLIFLAALSRKPKCPTNYIPTSPDSNTCIRFFTTGQSFAAAQTACQNDGGVLLNPDVVNFDIVRALADANKGAGPCDFWIGAREAASGVWSDLNGQSISTIGGLFFENAGDFDDNLANECGILDNTRSFYLYGETCANSNCFICAKNKII